jgi:hypothetical protein
VAQDAAPPPVTFYVATDGSDVWSGRLAAPNAAKTDGPFVTMKRAQAAARPAAAQGGVSVVVRGGFYALAEPLTFGPTDGGASPDAPVRYSAYPGETPILSGGTRITGWKRSGRSNRWEVTLPEVAQGTWRFSQLYVGGERRLRPRLPREGYFEIGSSYPATEKSKGKGHDRFIYRKGDIDPSWQNRGDIELLALHLWSMSRFNIADIDPTQRVVTLAGHTRNATGINYILPHGNRYLVENVKEALSRPGEWYLDRKTGVLTYLARSGEDPNRNEVIAPRLERLLELDGTANLTFQGLTFAHAAWNIGPEGVNTGQAEIGIPPALHLTNARNVTLNGCTVRNIGNYAVQFGRGSKNCALSGCTLLDMGAGGVMIGEMSNPREEAQRVSHNIVRDCLIAEGGRLHPAAVGVWIGQSPNNTVEHNEIVDFYYTGVSTGWTWGYGPNVVHDNRIAYNHIHKLGQGVLTDIGGIYNLGVSPGTVYDHNLIHDVQSYDYGGWGIYFDEGSTGLSATNNVVFDCKSSPFHQHYGTKNLVENNVFALGREAQIIRARADNNKSVRPEGAPDMGAESSFTMRRNIIYGRDALLLGNQWTGTNFTLAFNLYWGADPRMPVRFPGNRNLQQWQGQGHDEGSLVADPRFAAPEKGDFKLLPDSPAVEKIGFTPIDLRGVGRRTGTPYTRNAPRTFPPMPANRRYVADGFEDTLLRDRPSSQIVAVNEEGNPPAATVRVTDETAASGKRSLKITDMAGQKNVYTPNFNYKLKLTRGVVTANFAIRLEPGAVVTHEWRDSDTPFNRGPSLRIAANGTLTANGKSLGKLPQGQWLYVTIACPLGAASTGTYDLTIRLPGAAAPLRYAKLPCDEAFRTLRNWGFVSETDGPSVFYLDDLSLTVSEEQ